jgi:phosphatidylethanolamine-binding protein (PEBP) family uncharacterized protein
MTFGGRATAAHARLTVTAGRYHFRLLVLSIDSLPLGTKYTCVEVEREARKHIVAEATLIGIYQRR